MIQHAHDGHLTAVLAGKLEVKKEKRDSDPQLHFAFSAQIALAAPENVCEKHYLW
jgi:hypothetical protein